MKFKRFLNTALAGAMVLSMAAPAFAADETDVTTAGGSAETVISGTVQELTIKVTVPSTGSVIVNPYKLDVDIDGSTTSDDTIISAPQYIKSLSNVDLDVGVTVTGAVEGNAKLATTALTSDVTTNSVYMYFQMGTATADNGTGDPTWGAYSEANDILVGTKAVKKDSMVTLAAASDTDDDDTATFAAFHVAGDAVSTPKTPWASTDKVNVTVAFTFTPVAATSGS